MEYEVLSLTILALGIFIGLGVTLADNPRILEKRMDKIIGRFFK